MDYGTKARLIKKFILLLDAMPRTVLFVTHDADEALSLGDEIIVIKNGAIILKKERSQLTRDALISALIEN